VDNAVEGPVDESEMLPVATLISPNPFFRTDRRSRSRAWRAWSLYQRNSSPVTSGSKATSPKGGHVMKTMTEVRELLPTNPAASVCKQGLLDENMNIPRVGCSEEDISAQLVH
jgi:hypothetical protein